MFGQWGPLRYGIWLYLHGLHCLPGETEKSERDTGRWRGWSPIHKTWLTEFGQGVGK